MPRKLHVAMDEIIDAMTAPPEDPARFYLDLTEGRVEIQVNEDFQDRDEDDAEDAVALDPKRYREIPKTEARDEYALMGRFAESVDEDDIAEKLGLALAGKGAFARFRDVVFRYPDLKARWHAMRQEWLVGEAELWLRGLDIEPEYELRPVPAAPAPAPAKPRIGLLDMLLLGAPDGKTELIDGRVWRQVLGKTPSEARAIFKNLARDLCDFFGVAWRNRFIEGKNEFQLERAHLRLEERTVVLEIDVPTAMWRAFEE
ncbi:MAG TPA: UPF0158 family protein [Polyangia bacterium]|jgi:hypothetical protein